MRKGRNFLSQGCPTRLSFRLETAFVPNEIKEGYRIFGERLDRVLKVAI
ncbi:MAG: hypothetical protein AB1555_06820 [Nitrospirota bacterium]